MRKRFLAAALAVALLNLAACATTDNTRFYLLTPLGSSARMTCVVLQITFHPT